MSNKKTKLYVRILAWVLAILMVSSLAILGVQLITDAIRENNKENTEQSDDHAGHDHD